MDFLTHLFDTSGFPPRWSCGNWTAAEGWLHILSDLGVWSAYVAIPCVLGFFLLRRRDLPFRAVFLLFGAFILACGTTHLMEAVIFWWPAYRLAGLIKLFTALVSWATVIALVPVVPRVLAMRSPEELEAEIAARTAELTRANAALRESEARFRQLADAMPAIVWAARPDGETDYYNERWYEFTGFPRGENGLASWEPVLHPDDRQRCLDTYFGCVAAETPYQIEYRFRDRATGGFRWFLGRALPVRDESGRVVRWFGTCTDIDDTKRLQEELREADRRKDEFLAVLAHELRNPLAPIRNGLEALRRAGGDRAAVERSQTVMARQLGHMVRLVDDLLDASRVSRGLVELRRERLDLRDAIGAAAEAAEPAVRERGHALTLDLPTDPVPLDADATRLAQVFGNLLHNAAKYTPPGGRIRVAAERDGGGVVVTVSDNGVGIPADMLTRVFDMFTQADRSLEKTQGGLGIGLTIVKRLVELHGGTVEARSPGRGAGSAFVVRLPVTKDAGGMTGDERPAPAHPCSVTPRTSRKVLVVDDNRDAAESLATVIELMGHTVRTAHDGLDGVAAAADFRPDLILMDVGMPRLNGFDATRRIREQPWAAGGVIVALTGWGQDEDRRKSREAGCDAHLVKPMNPTALESLLAGKLTPVGGDGPQNGGW